MAPRQRCSIFIYWKCLETIVIMVPNVCVFATLPTRGRELAYKTTRSNKVFRLLRNRLILSSICVKCAPCCKHLPTQLVDLRFISPCKHHHFPCAWEDVTVATHRNWFRFKQGKVVHNGFLTVQRFFLLNKICGARIDHFDCIRTILQKESFILWLTQYVECRLQKPLHRVRFEI